MRTYQLAALVASALFAAACGGVVSGIGSKQESIIIIPGGRKVNIGIIADILRGTIGGIAGAILMSRLTAIDPFQAYPKAWDIAYFLCLCVLLGYVGERVLSTYSSQLLKRVDKIEEAQQEIAQEIEETQQGINKIAKENLLEDRMREVAWYRAEGRHNEVFHLCTSILRDQPDSVLSHMSLVSKLL